MAIMKLLQTQSIFEPSRLAKELLTTKEDIALSAGLGRDAVSRSNRVRSAKTQKRLREMTEVLMKAEPRFGSPVMAYAWYRAFPIPGFSGATAMSLVAVGRANEVLEYFDAVDAGVHA